MSTAPLTATMTTAPSTDRFYNPLCGVAVKPPRPVGWSCGLCLLLLLLVVAGCASKTPRKPTQGQLQIEVAESARTVMDPDLSRVSRALHSFLVGQLAYEKEDLKTATSHLSLAGELVRGSVPDINIPLAELKLKAGDLSGALVEVEKALQADGENPQLVLLHAGILEALGREYDALNEYLELTKRKSGGADPFFLAAAIYGHTRAFGQGIELLERYRKDDPRNNLVQYLLGVLYENAGSFTRASRHYQEIVKRTPDNVSVQFDRLRVMLKAGDRSRAAVLAREMLEGRPPGGVVAAELLRHLASAKEATPELLRTIKLISPDEITLPDMRLKLALVNLQQQQFSAALREFSIIIAGTPDNSIARYYRASLYGGAGRRKEAYEDLSAIRPDQELFIKSRMFSAFLKKQEGDFTGAEKAVREALAAQPGDAALFSYLILVLREGRQYERALALINQELTKTPASERLLFNKGIVLSDLNRMSEARSVMEQVIANNPRNADALNFIAYDLAEKGHDFDRAEILVQQALEISPQDGFYLDTLGWINFQRGDYERAVEILRRAYKLSGGDVVVSEHFGDALVKSDNAAEAAEVYRIALEKGRDEDPSERSAEVVEALPRLAEKLELLIKANPHLVPARGVMSGAAPQ